MQTHCLLQPTGATGSRRVSHHPVPPLSLPCRTAYPFWPNSAAVAEAAIQLPDEPEEPALQPAGQQELQGQQAIQLLMSKRRSFMQQAHYEWWADYSRPGAAPPQE